MAYRQEPTNCLIKKFHQVILSWYSKNGRNYFWRSIELSPWQWIFLESCLKRTKAETVNKYGFNLLRKYCKPEYVIKSDKKDLIKDLRPLGLYNQREIALKKIANIIINEYNGKIPDDENLLKIPYIGNYISNAVLCFSYNKKVPLIDVNISRVLTRVFDLPVPKDLRNRNIIVFANALLPIDDIKNYNYGLIDIGALYCKSKPVCNKCCLKNMCKYHLSN